MSEPDDLLPRRITRPVAPAFRDLLEPCETPIGPEPADEPPLEDEEESPS